MVDYFVTQCCVCKDYKLKDKWFGSEIINTVMKELYKGEISHGYCSPCVKKELEALK